MFPTPIHKREFNYRIQTEPLSQKSLIGKHPPAMMNILFNGNLILSFIITMIIIIIIIMIMILITMIMIIITMIMIIIIIITMILLKGNSGTQHHICKPTKRLGDQIKSIESSLIKLN